jgi:hypothetical protein
VAKRSRLMQLFSRSLSSSTTGSADNAAAEKLQRAQVGTKEGGQREGERDRYGEETGRGRGRDGEREEEGRAGEELREKGRARARARKGERDEGEMERGRQATEREI